MKDTQLVRLNKYLAHEGYATRREADALIASGAVFVNGRRAALGERVSAGDRVEVRAPAKTCRYFAYHKPRGVISHSPAAHEKDIRAAAGIPGVFPVGRLDKDSSGLIILTDDGRVTERLLSPAFEHEKEYTVDVKEKLSPSFARKMERGVDIEGYKTALCRVKMLDERRFSIVLTEGKKHQIRRMCAALGYVVADLKRTRVMSVTLGALKPGDHRQLKEKELATFLSDLGLA